MPDFNKDLSPILKDLSQPDFEPHVWAAKPVEPPHFNDLLYYDGTNGDLKEKGDTLESLSNRSKNAVPKGKWISDKELDDQKRYPFYNPSIENYEDAAGAGQSGWVQAKNGLLKGLNLTATTVAGGFGTLYGAGKWALGGKMSDIWDNPAMQALDDWNNKVDQEYLPNYYTDKQTNAEWYSRDNWLTSNFLFDKLIKNAGFAAGAMLSGNLADAAILRAGAGLGKLAMAGAELSEANQAFKIATPLLKNTARAFSQGKNVEAANVLEQGLSSIGDLEAKSSALAAIAKSTNQFAKIGDTARRTALAAYSQAGEASFEALSTSKEYRNTLIEDYKLKNGHAPMGEDLKEIDDATAKIGKTSFLGNMALLAVTEYAQLPKLLGSSYAADKQVANSLLGRVDDVAFKEGKYVGVGPVTKFGKFYEGSKRIASYVFDPKEAGQEIGQYALQVGSNNYYKKGYEGKEADAWADGFLYGVAGVDERGKAVGALNSKEGIESGVLGGITGGLMQGILTHGAYKATQSNTERFINSLNEAPNFKAAFKDKLASANRGVKLQQQEQEAVKQGDRLEATDLRYDQMHNYLSTRIKYGRFDMIMSDISDIHAELNRPAKLDEADGLATLKEQGIANINDTRESFSKRLADFETTAKNIEQIHKAVNLRYSGEVLTDKDGKPVLDPKGNKLRKYSDKVLDKMIYSASKIADYETRLPKITSKLTDNGIVTYDVLHDILEKNKPNLEATQKALQDINALDVISDEKNDLKTRLTDSIEVSMRRKAFMNEYDDIKTTPLNYEEDAEFAPGESLELPAPVFQKEIREGRGRRKLVETPLEVGKEYSLKESLRNENGDLILAPKMTVLKQTLGGEYEVRMPNGAVKFLTPAEFKNYTITEEDNRFEGMEDMLHQAFTNVLNTPKFAEDKEAIEKGGFNDLAGKLFLTKMTDSQELTNAVEKEFNKLADAFLKERRERAAKEELFKKKKEEWSGVQTTIVSKAASVPGVDTSKVEHGKEPAKKDESHLFRDSTTESEDRNDVRLSRPHVKRARVFLNKIDRHKKRGDMRSVLVHAGNAHLYGLEGIVQMSYGKDLNTPVEDLGPEVTDVDKGFLAQVYMVLENGKSYFVDENGNKISDKPISADNKVDLNKVIFQTMSTTELYYTNGIVTEPKFRADQKEQAEYEQKAYKLFRQGLWAKPERSSMYKFDISRGFPVEVDGAREFNQVGGILLDESTIENQQELIDIPTTGTVSHGERLMKFPNGVPVLKYGATVTFLNNRLLTSNEASTLYRTIERVAEVVSRQMEKGEPIRPESPELTYIRSMLYWTKGDTKAGNQIRIDEESMQLVIGDQAYNLTDVGNKEEEITEQLKKAYFTTNNKTLKAEFSTPFTEFYIDKKNQLQEREWTNYQTFLLASKYPDGSARPAGATPLTTSVAKPTPDVPYAFKQRYASLLGLDFPVPAGEAKPTAKPAAKTSTAPSEAVVIDGHTIDGATENTWTTEHATKDTVNFTARIENGEVITTVTGGPAVERIMKDEAGELDYIRDIFSEEEGIDKATPEELAKKFFNGRISLRLNQEYKAGRFTKPGPKAAPVVVVSGHTIDDKAENTFTTGIGDTVVFTAKIVDGEIVAKTLRGPAVDRIKDDPAQLEQAKDFLRPDMPTIDSATPLEAAEAFWNARISVTLTKAYQEGEQPPVTPPVEEEKPEAPPTPPTPPSAGGFFGTPSTSGFDDDEVPFRVVGFDGKERTSKYDLALFKEWAAKNVPTIPYEVMENLITMKDGRKAWGVFEDGVAKFVKGGLRGTEYHEVLEAVWFGFLSPEEQQAILADERTKTGTFKDRETGKKYSYSDPKVSDKILKERIMDDFSDYRLGKLPARSLGEKVRRFFKRIMDFFKSFVNKPSLKDELFKAVDTGKFKDFTLNPNVMSMAPEYRAVEGLTETETHLLVDDILARAAGTLFTTDQKELLYEPRLMESDDLFGRVEAMYEKIREVLPDGSYGISRREKLTDNQWEQLKIKVKDALRARNINTITEGVPSNEGANKNDYVKETFSIEGKSGSSRAVKTDISTMIERQPGNQEQQSSFKLPDFKYTKAKTLKLMNFNQTFNTLLAKLSNTTGVQKYINKVVDLANNDANYISHFQRLGGNLEDKDVPFSEFDFVDWRFFIDNWQTFSKQKPTALIQYKELDKVYTGAANLFDAVRQEQSKWIENMKTISQGEEGLIKYERETRTYNIDEAKLKEYPINNPTGMIALLKDLGIEFPMSAYKKLKTEKEKGKSSQQEQFSKAVSSLHKYVSERKQIMSLSGKILNVNEQLMRLGELYVKVTNPNFDPTYFGVEGQRVGAYTENNAPSVFENEFNECETLDELLTLRPELHDIFSENSQVLKLGGLFFNKDGERTSRKLKVKYIQGNKDLNQDKGTTTSALGIGERAMLEINQNLKGDYYILIPADGTTEWMMNLGHTVDFKLFDEKGNTKAWNKINEVFTGYLFDDVKLALDAPNRSKLKTVKARGATQLRFFRDILSDKKEYEKVLGDIDDMVTDGVSTFKDIEDYILTKQDTINDAIRDYIKNTTASTEALLKDNSQLSVSEDGLYTMSNLDETFVADNNINKWEMSETLKDNLLTFSNANYIINNIEYHKILFGDPLQFAEKDGKLDLIKRIKSFLSPRRTTFDHPEFNTFLNNNLNEVGDGIKLTKNDYGYHKFKEYISAVVLKNHIIYGSLSAINKAYGNTDESDAFSFLRDSSYRDIKIRNKQWTTQAEAFHQWQMAYTRQKLSQKGEYDYKKNKALEAHDIALIKKVCPEHRIEVLKPIITGNKYGMTQLEQLLHKTAQMPVYYSMVEGKTMESMYIKMFKEDIGYTIVASGAKMGIEQEHSTYNQDGTFNTDKYNNTLQVPWKAYGLQVETATDHRKFDVTRGSQLTKMASMNLFSDGHVIGATPERQKYIRDEYNNNIKLLNRMHQNAYNELLKSLSIVDMGDNFVMTDGKVVSETLMNELMRRAVSDNLKDTLDIDPDTNMFRIPFEASPSYVQIRNVLYSMVDKAIVSPKVHGGSYVQVPVTMFEEATKGRSLAIKTETGYEKITKEQFKALTEEEKKKVVLTDDTLKFYEDKDGKRHCEIMIPHWFKDSFPRKKGETDKEQDARILSYLNDKNNPERANILRGIGFRIPTQSLSSVEVFKIKGFLPQYMGNTVVVPSEITTKAGSDFDIDKLNLYLKAIYTDTNGNVRMVKLHGSEESTKAYYGNVFDADLKKKIERLARYERFRERLISILRKVDVVEGEEISDYAIEAAMDTEEDLDFYQVHKDIINEIIDQAFDADALPSEYIIDQNNRLKASKNYITDKFLNEKLRENFVKRMYKNALENEYYQSLENLITLPEVFNQLIKPVDDAGLSKIAERLDKLRGEDETTIKNRTLDRTYMTQQRHAFVIAKKWVGVAAQNITNLSLKQKGQVYVSTDQFENLPEEDQRFLGDGIVQLNHNSYTINDAPAASLSGTTVKGKKELISDRYSGYATSFVDVAKDPFILKIIQSDLVISTFMFLENIGVGEHTAFFLNQPIISEYLKMLDGRGAKTLYDEKNLASIRGKFGISTELRGLDEGKIDITKFEENIKNYYKDKSAEFSPDFKAEQSNVLDEFLKYAKMADYAFEFAQATNYDTTRVTSGDHFARKQWQTDEVAKNSIIVGLHDVLKSTFIGEQKDVLDKSMWSMGAILKLEDRNLRAITEKVLKPYGLNKYMSSDDFNKVANKIKSAFLDFIIQSKTEMYDEIYDLVVDGETSVASELEDLKKKYPESNILNELQVVSGVRPGGAKSVTISVRPTDAYDENRYVGMMKEMRDANEELRNFYDRLIKISIVQGVSPSAINIKNIIPIEDYSAIVAPVMEQLVADPSLEIFAEGFFQRNQFKDDSIVPKVDPGFRQVGKMVDGMFNPADVVDVDPYGVPIFQHETFAFANFPSKGVSANDRKLLVLGENRHSRFMKFDFVKVPRIVGDYFKGRVDMLTGRTVTDADFKDRKTRGDYTLNDMFGYQKVKDAFGNPLVINYQETGDQHVYKLVNLYGDGNRATENYPDFRPSVIDNGSAKIEYEMTDEEVFELYGRRYTPIIEDPITLEDIEQIEDSKEYAEAVLNYVNAKKVSKGLLKVDGQHYFLPFEFWKSQQKAYGFDLFIYPPGAEGTEYEEIYIASSYTGGEGFFSDETEGRADAAKKEAPAKTETPVVTDRTMKIDQFNITIKPDGKMYFENGNEVTDQTIQNKVKVNMQTQDGTLRVAIIKKGQKEDKYFVLLDDTIVGSGKTNYGKTLDLKPATVEAILAKAITTKKTC